MSDFANAPDSVLAERSQLADQVCLELQRAGIPAFRQANLVGKAGAEIEVDAGDDAAGGVFVNWRPDPELSRARAESIQNSDFSSPVIQHSGVIVSHMCNAIVGILNSAGFRAAVANDDMRPMSVHVEGP